MLPLCTHTQIQINLSSTLAAHVTRLAHYKNEWAFTYTYTHIISIDGDGKRGA